MINITSYVIYVKVSDILDLSLEKNLWISRNLFQLPLTNVSKTCWNAVMLIVKVNVCLILSGDKDANIIMILCVY